MEKKLTIYQRALIKGAEYVSNCTMISEEEHERLMKGARKANKKKVISTIKKLDIFDPELLKYINPFTQYITKTHIIFVHSAIEHFIKVKE